MTKREILLERMEETAFALMMDEVAREEGRKALEENERLQQDESFVVPEATYRRGLTTIRRHFSQKNRRTTMRTASKVISKVAVIVLVMLLLFTTAFATIPELRTKTLNLIMEVFDDRTRIEFGDSAPEARAGENESIVGWVPEGFELVDKGERDFVVWEKYTDSERAFIEANIYYGDGLAYGVDTEDAFIEDVMVNECAAKIIFKDNDIEVVCPVVDSMRVYHVRGENVDSDTVLRVAESMTIH